MILQDLTPNFCYSVALKIRVPSSPFGVPNCSASAPIAVPPVKTRNKTPKIKLRFLILFYIFLLLT